MAVRLGKVVAKENLIKRVYRYTSRLDSTLKKAGYYSDVTNARMTFHPKYIVVYGDYSQFTKSFTYSNDISGSFIFDGTFVQIMERDLKIPETVYNSYPKSQGLEIETIVPPLTPMLPPPRKLKQNVTEESTDKYTNKPPISTE